MIQYLCDYKERMYHTSYDVIKEIKMELIAFSIITLFNRECSESKSMTKKKNEYIKKMFPLDLINENRWIVHLLTIIILGEGVCVFEITFSDDSEFWL